jgi:hypothetical protein
LRVSEQRPDPHGSHEAFDREIGVRGIVRFAIGMALIVVVSGLVSWWLFVRLRSDEERRDLPPSPIVQREGAPQVPEPRLQTTPEQDLAATRAQERALLDGYAWVDRNRAVARVPVEVSMHILLRQGLPTRTGAQEWHRPVWRDPTRTRHLRPEEQP